MRTIDADALKEAIKNDIYVVDYGVEGAIYGMFWSGIENAIDEQPTEEQKTGKWVNNINDMPICNQCGYMTPYDRAIDDYEYGNYCPMCGAKMEVQDD